LQSQLAYICVEITGHLHIFAYLRRPNKPAECTMMFVDILIETDKILVKRNRTVRQNNTSEAYH
jgi:hypothetical protein